MPHRMGPDRRQRIRGKLTHLAPVHDEFVAERSRVDAVRGGDAGDDPALFVLAAVAQPG